MVRCSILPTLSRCGLPLTIINVDNVSVVNESRYGSAASVTACHAAHISANGGVLAPSVLIEDGWVRLWFHGFETDAAGAIIKARIGYAAHVWPLD